MSEIRHVDEVRESSLRFVDEKFIWRFSPNQTDPELLEAISVGREPLLQNVHEKIAESAKTAATHHVLLYGPRGIGKSHFTALLHHRLNRDKTLEDSVHIAWLNEDETTTSLVQLLVRIYRALSRSYPDDYSAKWLDDLLNESPEEVSDVLTGRLIARFEKRRLVVLVENLNMLFEGLGSKGQKALRSLLQEHPFACLVATSQQLFKSVSDRKEPFFGFFQQVPLAPLSLSEAQQLLVNIAKFKGQNDLLAFLNTADGRGRVRAIHDLAGGNHRVYIVLSGFATRESLDQLVAPFQKMADDLTPYYQERLRWISPLQRQIVELLCRTHSTLNPKEIARRLLVDQRSIGKQVRELSNIGYLFSSKRGKETFYELSEPLMRLAYEVKEQSLLDMLVEFLRIWYRPDELAKLRKARLSESTKAYAEAAWKRSQDRPDPRLEILARALEEAKQEGREAAMASLWEERAVASKSPKDWVSAGRFYHRINDQLYKALDCFDEALFLDSSSGDAWLYKGNVLRNLGKEVESIQALDKAVALLPGDCYAWFSRGYCLSDFNQSEAAINSFDKALTIDPEYAIALSFKGIELKNSGERDDALVCFSEAIRVAPNDAFAHNLKANLLWEVGQNEEALVSFTDSLEVDPKYEYSWEEKGELLSSLGRYDEAFDTYEGALKQGVYFDGVDFRRSEALIKLGRWDEAFESMGRGLKNLKNDSNDYVDITVVFTQLFSQQGELAKLETQLENLINIYQNVEVDHVGNLPSTASGGKDRVAPTNYLAYLADGLVKSLPGINKTSADELNKLLSIVEKCINGLPDFEVALRLFRYGIRYLISGEESEFVELIQTERGILRQVFDLPEEF